jgi:hypothetical protein
MFTPFLRLVQAAFGLAAFFSLLAAARSPVLTSNCQIQFTGVLSTVADTSCTGSCDPVEGNPVECALHFNNTPSGGKQWSCRCGGQGGSWGYPCHGEMQFSAAGIFEMIICADIGCGSPSLYCTEQPNPTQVPSGETKEACPCKSSS